MSLSGSPTHNVWTRAVAFFLSFIFSSSTIAQSAPLVETPARPLEISLHGNSVEDFLSQVPQEIGALKETYRSRAAAQTPLFIHIQDAHANPEAQQNIHRLLQYLDAQFSKQNSRLIVAVESAKGALHPEYYDFFPKYPEAGEAVIRDLLEKGELTGAELFAWEKYRNGSSLRGQQSWPKQSAFVFGVEDTALYRDNLKTYQNLLFRRSEFKPRLDQLRSQLFTDQSKVLNRELFNFIRERGRRKEGKYTFERSGGNGNLEAYLDYLKSQAAKSLEIDLLDPIEQLRFPNLIRILLIKKAEAELDRNKAASEWNRVLKQVHEKAASGPEKRFAGALDLFRSKNSSIVSPRRLLEQLYLFSQAKKIELSSFKQFILSFRIAVFQAELDAAELMAEIDGLEKAILEKLTKTGAEKIFLRRLENFWLLEKLLYLELGRGEYEEVLARKMELENFIVAKGPQKIPLSLRGQRSWPKQSPFFSLALHFYDTARKRDRALVENTLSIIASSSHVIARSEATKQPVVVLITGGFHSDGIKEILKAKDISFAEYMPRISSLDSGERYERVMSEANADLTSYFKVKNPFRTKQEALLFKEALEVAAPALPQTSGPPTALAQIQEAFAAHTILRKAVIAEPGSNAAPALRLIPVSAPQIPSRASVGYVLNSAAAGFASEISTGVGARTNYFPSFSIEKGKLRTEWLAAPDSRSEVRTPTSAGDLLSLLNHLDDSWVTVPQSAFAEDRFYTDPLFGEYEPYLDYYDVTAKERAIPGGRVRIRLDRGKNNEAWVHREKFHIQFFADGQKPFAEFQLDDVIGQDYFFRAELGGQWYGNISLQTNRRDPVTRIVVDHEGRQIKIAMPKEILEQIPPEEREFQLESKKGLHVEFIAESLRSEARTDVDTIVEAINREDFSRAILSQALFHARSLPNFLRDSRRFHFLATIFRQAGRDPNDWMLLGEVGTRLSQLAYLQEEPDPGKLGWNIDLFLKSKPGMPSFRASLEPLFDNHYATARMLQQHIDMLREIEVTPSDAEKIAKLQKLLALFRSEVRTESEAWEQIPFPADQFVAALTQIIKSQHPEGKVEAQSLLSQLQQTPSDSEIQAKVRDFFQKRNRELFGPPPVRPTGEDPGPLAGPDPHKFFKMIFEEEPPDLSGPRSEARWQIKDYPVLQEANRALLLRPSSRVEGGIIIRSMPTSFAQSLSDDGKPLEDDEVDVHLLSTIYGRKTFELTNPHNPKKKIRVAIDLSLWDGDPARLITEPPEIGDQWDIQRVVSFSYQEEAYHAEIYIPRPEAQNLRSEARERDENYVETKKSLGERIGIPRKGWRSSKSLSPDTIADTLPARAHSNTALSLGSRQALIAALGLTILADWWIREMRSEILRSGISALSLGREKTVTTSSSNRGEITSPISAEMILRRSVRGVPLPANALTSTLVSTTISLMNFLAGLFHNLFYFALFQRVFLAALVDLAQEQPPSGRKGAGFKFPNQLNFFMLAQLIDQFFDQREVDFQLGHLLNLLSSGYPTLSAAGRQLFTPYMPRSEARDKGPDHGDEIRLWDTLHRMKQLLPEFLEPNPLRQGKLFGLLLKLNHLNHQIGNLEPSFNVNKFRGDLEEIRGQRSYYIQALAFTMSSGLSVAGLLGIAMAETLQHLLAPDLPLFWEKVMRVTAMLIGVGIPAVYWLVIPYRDEMKRRHVESSRSEVREEGIIEYAERIVRLAGRYIALVELIGLMDALAPYIAEDFERSQRAGLHGDGSLLDLLFVHPGFPRSAEWDKISWQDVFRDMQSALEQGKLFLIHFRPSQANRSQTFKIISFAASSPADLWPAQQALNDGVEPAALRSEARSVISAPLLAMLKNPSPVLDNMIRDTAHLARFQHEIFRRAVVRKKRGWGGGISRVDLASLDRTISDSFTVISGLLHFVNPVNLKWKISYDKVVNANRALSLWRHVFVQMVQVMETALIVKDPVELAKALAAIETFQTTFLLEVFPNLESLDHLETFDTRKDFRALQKEAKERVNPAPQWNFDEVTEAKEGLALDETYRQIWGWIYQIQASMTALAAALTALQKDPSVDPVIREHAGLTAQDLKEGYLKRIDEMERLSFLRSEKSRSEARKERKEVSGGGVFAGLVDQFQKGPKAVAQWFQWQKIRMLLEAFYSPFSRSRSSGVINQPNNSTNKTKTQMAILSQLGNLAITSLVMALGTRMVNTFRNVWPSAFLLFLPNSDFMLEGPLEIADNLYFIYEYVNIKNFRSEARTPETQIRELLQGWRLEGLKTFEVLRIIKALGERRHNGALKFNFTDYLPRQNNEVLWYDGSWLKPRHSLELSEEHRQRLQNYPSDVGIPFDLIRLESSVLPEDYLNSVIASYYHDPSAQISGWLSDSWAEIHIEASRTQAFLNFIINNEIQLESRATETAYQHASSHFSLRWDDNKKILFLQRYPSRFQHHLIEKILTAKEEEALPIPQKKPVEFRWGTFFAILFLVFSNPASASLLFRWLYAVFTEKGQSHQLISGDGVQWFGNGQVLLVEPNGFISRSILTNSFLARNNQFFADSGDIIIGGPPYDQGIRYPDKPFIPAAGQGDMVRLNKNTIAIANAEAGRVYFINRRGTQMGMIDRLNEPRRLLVDENAGQFFIVESDKVQVYSLPRLIDWLDEDHWAREAGLTGEAAARSEARSYVGLAQELFKLEDETLQRAVSADPHSASNPLVELMEKFRASLGDPMALALVDHSLWRILHQNEKVRGIFSFLLSVLNPELQNVIFVQAGLIPILGRFAQNPETRSLLQELADGTAGLIVLNPLAMERARKELERTDFSEAPVTREKDLEHAQHADAPGEGASSGARIGPFEKFDLKLQRDETGHVIFEVGNHRFRLSKKDFHDLLTTHNRRLDLEEEIQGEWRVLNLSKAQEYHNFILDAIVSTALILDENQLLRPFPYTADLHQALARPTPVLHVGVAFEREKEVRIQDPQGNIFVVDLLHGRMGPVDSGGGIDWLPIGQLPRNSLRILLLFVYLPIVLDPALEVGAREEKLLGYHSGFLEALRLASLARSEARENDLQTLLDTPLAEIGASLQGPTGVRVRKLFYRSNFETLRDVVNETPATLLKSKNFGVASLNYLRTWLKGFGLQLRGDGPDQPYHLEGEKEKAKTKVPIDDLGVLIKNLGSHQYDISALAKRALLEKGVAIVPALLKFLSEISLDHSNAIENALGIIRNSGKEAEPWGKDLAQLANTRRFRTPEVLDFANTLAAIGHLQRAVFIWIRILKQEGISSTGREVAKKLRDAGSVALPDLINIIQGGVITAAVIGLAAETAGLITADLHLIVEIRSGDNPSSSPRSEARSLEESLQTLDKFNREWGVSELANEGIPFEDVPKLVARQVGASAFSSSLFLFSKDARHNHDNFPVDTPYLQLQLTLELHPHLVLSSPNAIAQGHLLRQMYERIRQRAKEQAEAIGVPFINRVLFDYNQESFLWAVIETVNETAQELWGASFKPISISNDILWNLQQISWAEIGNLQEFKKVIITSWISIGLPATTSSAEKLKFIVRLFQKFNQNQLLSLRSEARAESLAPDQTLVSEIFKAEFSKLREKNQINDIVGLLEQDLSGEPAVEKTKRDQARAVYVLEELQRLGKRRIQTPDDRDVQWALIDYGAVYSRIRKILGVELSDRYKDLFPKRIRPLVELAALGEEFKTYLPPSVIPNVDGITHYIAEQLAHLEPTVASGVQLDGRDFFNGPHSSYISQVAVNHPDFEPGDQTILFNVLYRARTGKYELRVYSKRGRNHPELLITLDENLDAEGVSIKAAEWVGYYLNRNSRSEARMTGLAILLAGMWVSIIGIIALLKILSMIGKAKQKRIDEKLQRAVREEIESQRQQRPKGESDSRSEVRSPDTRGDAWRDRFLVINRDLARGGRLEGARHAVAVAFKDRNYPEAAAGIGRLIDILLGPPFGWKESHVIVQQLQKIRRQIETFAFLNQEIGRPADAPWDRVAVEALQQKLSGLPRAEQDRFNTEVLRRALGEIPPPEAPANALIHPQVVSIQGPSGIDMIIDSDELFIDPGMTGPRTGRVLSNLGIPTRYFALASGYEADAYRYLIQQQQGTPVTDLLAGPSRTKIHFLLPDPQDLTKQPALYALPSQRQYLTDELAARLERYLAEHLPQAIRGNEVAIFSGQVFDRAPAWAISKLLSMVRAKGYKILADFRPGMRTEDLQAVLAGSPEFIKVDLTELAIMLGLPLPELRNETGEPKLETIASHLLGLSSGHHLKALIVTLEKFGAMMAYATPEGDYKIIYVPAASIHYKSSFGAGDSLIGSFLWKWMSGADLPASLVYGVAAGSVTAGKPAQLVLKGPEEIEAMAGQMKGQFGNDLVRTLRFVRQENPARSEMRQAEGIAEGKYNGTLTGEDGSHWYLVAQEWGNHLIGVRERRDNGERVETGIALWNWDGQHFDINRPVLAYPLPPLNQIASQGPHIIDAVIQATKSGEILGDAIFHASRAETREPMRVLLADNPGEKDNILALEKKYPGRIVFLKEQGIGRDPVGLQEVIRREHPHVLFVRSGTDLKNDETLRSFAELPGEFPPVILRGGSEVNINEDLARELGIAVIRTNGAPVEDLVATFYANFVAEARRNIIERRPLAEDALAIDPALAAAIQFPPQVYREAVAKSEKAGRGALSEEQTNRLFSPLRVKNVQALRGFHHRMIFGQVGLGIISTGWMKKIKKLNESLGTQSQILRYSRSFANIIETPLAQLKDQIVNYANVISIHLPSSAGTFLEEKDIRILAGRARPENPIAIMNTSRFVSVDHEALLQVLRELRTAGRKPISLYYFADIDLTDKSKQPIAVLESLRTEFPDNVFLTNHIGAFTAPALQGVERRSVIGFRRLLRAYEAGDLKSRAFDYIIPPVRSEARAAEIKPEHFRQGIFYAAFDYDDNLTKAQTPPSLQTLEALNRLLRRGIKIDIVTSGHGSYILPNLPVGENGLDPNRAHLVTIAAEAGGEAYSYRPSKRRFELDRLASMEPLTENEREWISGLFREVLQARGWGEKINEDTTIRKPGFFNLRPNRRTAVTLALHRDDKKFHPVLVDMLPEIQRRVHDKFGERFHASVSSVAIEIALSRKGDWVRKRMRELELQPEEVLVSGDSAQPGGNDRSMFEIPGVLKLYSGPPRSDLTLDTLYTPAQGPEGLARVLDMWAGLEERFAPRSEARAKTRSTSPKWKFVANTVATKLKRQGSMTPQAAAVELWRALKEEGILDLSQQPFLAFGNELPNIVVAILRRLYELGQASAVSEKPKRRKSRSEARTEEGQIPTGNADNEKTKNLELLRTAIQRAQQIADATRDVKVAGFYYDIRTEGYNLILRLKASTSDEVTSGTQKFIEKYSEALRNPPAPQKKSRSEARDNEASFTVRIFPGSNLKSYIDKELRKREIDPGRFIRVLDEKGTEFSGDLPQVVIPVSSRIKIVYDFSGISSLLLGQNRSQTIPIPGTPHPLEIKLKKVRPGTVRNNAVFEISTPPFIIVSPFSLWKKRGYKKGQDFIGHWIEAALQKVKQTKEERSILSKGKKQLIIFFDLEAKKPVLAIKIANIDMRGVKVRVKILHPPPQNVSDVISSTTPSLRSELREEKNNAISPEEVAIAFLHQIEAGEVRHLDSLLNIYRPGGPLYDAVMDRIASFEKLAQDENPVVSTPAKIIVDAYAPLLRGPDQRSNRSLDPATLFGLTLVAGISWILTVTGFRWQVTNYPVYWLAPLSAMFITFVVAHSLTTRRAESRTEEEEKQELQLLKDRLTSSRWPMSVTSYQLDDSRRDIDYYIFPFFEAGKPATIYNIRHDRKAKRIWIHIKEKTPEKTSEKDGLLLTSLHPLYNTIDDLLSQKSSLRSEARMEIKIIWGEIASLNLQPGIDVINYELDNGARLAARLEAKESSSSFAAVGFSSVPGIIELMEKSPKDPKYWDTIYWTLLPQTSAERTAALRAFMEYLRQGRRTDLHRGIATPTHYRIDTALFEGKAKRQGGQMILISPASPPTGQALPPQEEPGQGPSGGKGGSPAKLPKHPSALSPGVALEIPIAEEGEGGYAGVEEAIKEGLKPSEKPSRSEARMAWPAKSREIRGRFNVLQGDGYALSSIRDPNVSDRHFFVIYDKPVDTQHFILRILHLSPFSILFSDGRLLQYHGEASFPIGIGESIEILNNAAQNSIAVSVQGYAHGFLKFGLNSRGKFNIDRIPIYIRKRIEALADLAGDLGVKDLPQALLSLRASLFQNEDSMPVHERGLETLEALRSQSLVPNRLQNRLNDILWLLETRLSLLKQYTQKSVRSEARAERGKLDPSPETVRMEKLEALRHMVKNGLQISKPEVRTRIREFLLVKILDSTEDIQVRTVGVKLLAGFGKEAGEVAPRLLNLLRQPNLNRDLWRATAKSLAVIAPQSEEVIQVLAAALKDDDLSKALSAVRALNRIFIQNPEKVLAVRDSLQSLRTGSNTLWRLSRLLEERLNAFRKSRSEARGRAQSAKPAVVPLLSSSGQRAEFLSQGNDKVVRSFENAVGQEDVRVATQFLAGIFAKIPLLAASVLAFSNLSIPEAKAAVAQIVSSNRPQAAASVTSQQLGRLGLPSRTNQNMLVVALPHAAFDEAGLYALLKEGGVPFSAGAVIGPFESLASERKVNFSDGRVLIAAKTLEETLQKLVASVRQLGISPTEIHIFAGIHDDVQAAKLKKQWAAQHINIQVRAVTSGDLDRFAGSSSFWLSRIQPLRQQAQRILAASA